MITPSQLAERRYELSVLYGSLADELEEVLRQKATIWATMRFKHKSDKATDNAWDATELGIKEMSLRLQIKKNERESSGISSLLRIRELEAKNII